jgi:NO-binding membrane sensor protein with MHYT domain
MNASPYVQSAVIGFVTHYDLMLVALAAFLCALSAFTGITLLNHARRAEGPMRYAWLAIAGFSVGFGVWATHFIAIMAFAIGMPTGYDLPETLLSLSISVAITGGGLWFATAGGRLSDRTWRWAGRSSASALWRCISPAWRRCSSAAASSGRRRSSPFRW